MTRRLAFVLAATAVVLLVMGTGGFSAVTAERGVDARVVSDDRAYLGIEKENPEGIVYGEPVTILELTDRFADDVALTELDVQSPVVELETSTPTDVGESSPLAVEVRCVDVSTSYTVDVTMVVEGSATTAQVTRAVSVTCIPPDVEDVVDVEFDGCGNAHVSAEEPYYPLDVTKVVNTSSGTETSSLTLSDAGKVNGSPGGKLEALKVGIRFGSDTDRFENPNNCVNAGNSNTGNGSGNGNGAND